MNSLKFINGFTLKILSAFILYPFLVPIYVPLLFYRQIITFVVKIWDPKVCRIMSGIDALLVGENPYSKPILVLAPYFPFKTNLNRDQVVRMLDEKIIKPGVFPELTQRIVRKCGFNFWYQADNVCAEDHVKYLYPNCPDAPVTRSELRTLTNNQHWKQPFDPNRSPWEIILIPNFVDEEDPSIKSMLMLRVNHCLMDGYSALNFIRKAAVNPWKEPVNIPLTKQSAKSKASKLILLLATGPFHALKMLFFSNDKSHFMQNVIRFHKCELKQWQRKPVRAVYTSLARLKRMAKLHKVSMTGLLVTIAMEATIGVIRRKMGEHVCEKGMYLAMPLPYPGHPNRLTNHFTGVRLLIKVSRENPIKTLKEVSGELDRVRNSIVPTVNFVMCKLMGLLPACWMPKSETVVHQTITLSNFAGPSEKTDIFGHEYDRVGFTASGNDVGTAFVFIPLSCNGKMRIDSMGTGMLLRSNEDAEEFRSSINAILDTFEETSTRDNVGLK